MYFNFKDYILGMYRHVCLSFSCIFMFGKGVNWDLQYIVNHQKKYLKQESRHWVNNVNITWVSLTRFVTVYGWPH